MREFTGYLALGVTLVMGGVALAAEDPIDQNFERIIDAYRSSSHSPAEKRKLLSSLSKIASRQSTTAIADPPDGSVHSFEASINPPAPIKKDKAGLVLGPNLKFFLRQDFADIGGSLDAPTETKKAQGATISFARDVLGRNAIWSTQALGAAVYSIPGFEVPEQTSLVGAKIGAYATINKVFNSNSKNAAKNSDSVGGGGLAEFDVTRLLGGDHYFRFTAGGTSDRLTNVNEGSFVADWIPSYYNLYMYRPFEITPQLGIDFRPEVLLQYNGTNDQKNKLAFNNRSQAIRIGPQLTVVLFSFVDDPFWKRLSGQVTYHPYYETVSRHTNAWLKTSVTYNITEEGNIGITGSYKRGPDEETGTRTNLYKVSLTAKY
jgi:hypothetical protein